MMRFFRKIKWFVQRGKRGWADCDTRNLGSYLAKVIGESAGYLAYNHMGHPCYNEDIESDFCNCYPYDKDGNKKPDSIFHRCDLEYIKRLDDISIRCKEYLMLEDSLQDERAFEVIKPALESLIKEWYTLWD